VYDGQYPDLLVCPECWDPKHPQEYLPPVTDPVTIYDPTGDPDAAQANITKVPLFNPTGAVDPASGFNEVVPLMPMSIKVVVNAALLNIISGPADGIINIPDPQGTVLGVTGTTSLQVPKLFYSSNDIETWSETAFDDVLGGSQIGDLRGIAYNGSRWVAVGAQWSPTDNVAIWTCDDNVITPLSEWTERTAPFTDVNSVGGLLDVEYANGVFIATGGFLVSPIRAPVARSTDGITWTDVSFAQSNIAKNLKYRSGDEWWLATGNGSLCRSLNNGLTWAVLGIFGVGGEVNDFEFTDLSTEGDRLRMHTARESAGSNNGVAYKDGAGDFTRSLTGSVSAFNVIKHNPNTGTLIAAGDSGQVYRSTNNGESYTQITGFSTFISFETGIYDNSVEAPYGFIIAGRNISSGEPVLYTSTDDGVTWVPRVTDGLHDSLIYDLASHNEVIG
jgi:hypothetical protein